MRMPIDYNESSNEPTGNPELLSAYSQAVVNEIKAQENINYATKNNLGSDFINFTKLAYEDAKSFTQTMKTLYNDSKPINTGAQEGFKTSLFDSTPAPTPISAPILNPTPPVVPATMSTPVLPPPVKTAPIDTLLIDQDTIDVDSMIDLIWEDIGGQELINVARNDIVNGQTVSYQPIKNLTTIQQQYNPNNIVSLQNTSDKYFVNFPIKLETKLPGEGNGAGPNGAYVYIETSTGDLIIELIDLQTDEQVEVQISISGTIYEAEFNES